MKLKFKLYNEADGSMKECDIFGLAAMLPLNWEEVGGYHVRMSTGKTDIKGVTIYSDDIAKVNDVVGKIYYSTQFAQWYFQFKSGLEVGHTAPLVMFGGRLEVIGNKFTNKELLEDTE
jgi:hypothetical protein